MGASQKRPGCPADCQKAQLSLLEEGFLEKVPDAPPDGPNCPLTDRSEPAPPGVPGDLGVEGIPRREEGVRVGVRAAGIPASSASSRAPRVSPPHVSPTTTAPPPTPISAARPVRSRMSGSKIAGATI